MLKIPLLLHEYEYGGRPHNVVGPLNWPVFAQFKLYWAVVRRGRRSITGSFLVLGCFDSLCVLIRRREEGDVLSDRKRPMIR